ncbi:MAG: SMC family ATPase [Chloroflexi bacterium]|nr:SMC family ATPase [Chloroflexota bacterium]
MIPVRLELRNFLAYRAPDPIRFDGIHLACLTGPNGAGKSSLLDAITWALWGRARAKRDDDMIHQGQSDMLVQLDFEQEGIIYRVIRKRSRRNRGTGELNLYSLVDGQITTLSEPAMRDTQEKINRLLRLDYETFVHSAFLQQGKADAFTTQQPARRKQILSDILGLAQWEAYEAAARDMLKNIENELRVIDLRVKEIEDELAKEPRLKTQLVEAERAQQEALAALDAAEKRLEEVAFAANAMRSAQSNLADCERHLRERRHDLAAIDEDITRQQQRIAEYQATIEARDDIEAGYAALTSAREADFALGDKLLQLSDYDARCHELEKRLADARAALETEAGGYAATIAELERAVSNASPDELAEVQAQVIELQALEAERQQADAEARALAEEKAELEGVRKSLTTEGQNLRDRLERLKITTEATCPLCGQPLDADHRAELIAQLEEEIVIRRAEYSANQERMKDIGVELKGRKERVAELDLELKRLPPLIERAGKLQEQVDAANAAAARLDTERARLDAVRAMLEAEAFAQDIREQLAAAQAERARIGYDADTHTSARQKLETYREYDARYQQLQIALNSLDGAKAALEAAQLRHERTLKALAEDEESVDRLKAEISRLDVLVKEQQARQQEVNRLRTTERSAHQRLTIAQQELAAMDSQRARKADLEARCARKRHEESLYKELRAAFGKNGVPAMVIEAAIPELESSANRLLARMTDGRMSLNFSTQREKAAGDGVIETLDIQIADELGTRSYEMYSGGEAFRIDFAIRVALSQLLARRAGAHLRTLFIDEGFGTQDEDGRNKLVEAITAVQQEFDLILVITHIDDLRDSFPVHVVVQKTPNGSRVAVR